MMEQLRSKSATFALCMYMYRPPYSRIAQRFSCAVPVSLVAFPLVASFSHQDSHASTSRIPIQLRIYGT